MRLTSRHSDPCFDSTVLRPSPAARHPPATHRAAGAGRVLTLLASVAWLGACTDVQLRSIDAIDTVTVAGEVCTGRPSQTLRSVNVIFLVDSSLSMIINDPNNLRTAVIQHLVQKYATDPTVKFAVIRFGVQGQLVCENVDYQPGTTGLAPTFAKTGQTCENNNPPYFTNTPADLANIFARMSAPTNPDLYLAGSDYVAALTEAQKYLAKDMTTNQGNASTPQYVIEFVSDGEPQAFANPSATRQDILTSVGNLSTQFQVRTDTVLIASSVVTDPSFVNILPDMAAAGSGSFVQLAAVDGLDRTFSLALSSSGNLVEYEYKNLFVFNRNARATTFPPGPGGVFDVYPDSDGDGLIDPLEVQLGTSPTLCDSIGAGLPDSITLGVNPHLDLTGPGGADPDADGLPNAVEAALATKPDDPDTDHDGIPDDIEGIVGTSPLHNDEHADPDGDVVPTGAEVREATDPSTNEDQLGSPGFPATNLTGAACGGIRCRIAYRYVAPATDSPDATSYADGVRCYAFRVENIGLYRTKGGTDCQGRPIPEGTNVLEVNFVAKPHVDPNLPSSAYDKLPYRVFRARPWVIYRGKGQRDPATEEINVHVEDFTPGQ